MKNGKISRSSAADSVDVDIDSTNLDQHVQVFGGLLDARH